MFDEADRMFEMGFAEQVSCCCRCIPVAFVHQHQRQCDRYGFGQPEMLNPDVDIQTWQLPRLLRNISQG